ncbi:MAG: hypothetical protein Q4F88_06910 [Eubacteriales bacterium]|nr:hypothetical protein [Eubacteriales bacterium]
MAGMRKKVSKGHTVYSYTGDLAEVLKKAEKELNVKMAADEYSHLKWQADKATKALKRYQDRIIDLKDFIRIATYKLNEEKKEN